MCGISPMRNGCQSSALRFDSNQAVMMPPNSASSPGDLRRTPPIPAQVAKQKTDDIGAADALSIMLVACTATVKCVSA